MTQQEVLIFLSNNKIDVDNMSYNELNTIIFIADKIAEEMFKECLLIYFK